MPIIALLYDKTDNLRDQYEEALTLVGADVCIYEPEDFETDPEGTCAKIIACDGLVIPGGDDLDPALYGQTAIPACGKPQPARDHADMKSFEVFLPTGKPILGICRGAQAMNVFFGGTLHQDITPLQKLAHVDSPAKKTGSHFVSVTPDSKLAKIFGDTEVWVNTIHHQAADVLAKNLVATAFSPDGFVEAVELPTHVFCIGVQWHPEHLAETNPVQRKLFSAFVEACKKED